MTETRVSRKLAAILSADVVGYSKLMADNEAATVNTLKQYRDAVERVINQHDGRIVNAPGDNMLAEFPSAVEAVQAAVEIQRNIEGRNAELQEDRRMHFRIGLNLGDVIAEEDGTIYGDGVNIAARMEALAEEGGICISGTIHDAVEGKLDFGFDFLGERQVKNIEKPVRVYRVRGGAASLRQKPGSRASRRWRTLGVLATVVVMVGAIAVWFSTRTPESSETVVASTSEKRNSVLVPPIGPSIAVLPFVNQSGDPEQEYFSDGLTEDIITALSKVQRLLVIARTSSFQYKGEAVDVRQVGRDLSVRHVLEGSVRKEGNRVRVTAQLINASNGAHVWSERYDRSLNDIFAVQDEITSRIMAALDVQMVEGEQARVWRRSTNNVEAYEHFLRGREHVLKFTKEDFALAEIELKRAIELDSNFALAYTQLVSVPLVSVIFGVSDNPAKDIERAFMLQRKAVELDDSQGYSVVQLGRIYMQVGQLDKALELGKRAVALEPNGATTIAVYAHMLEAAGRQKESLAMLNKAYRLAPIPEAWMPWLEGNCLRQLGRYDEAIAAYERSIALAPKFLWPHVFLVDAYVSAGRMDEAKAKAREVVQFAPSFSVDRFLGLFVWYRDPSFLKDYAENLRISGLN